MGTFRETIAEGKEGALQLGPERARVYSDLSPEDKERYNADIWATNILLQELPKDIYTLINHYIDAKDIWDNVKMLLEGSELTKEDRESQLYGDFEHFRQNKGKNIYDYYVRFTKLINDIRNIKMTMPRMQLNSKFVNNMFPGWGRFVTTVKLNRGLKESNYDQLYAYLKQHEAHANEIKMMLKQFTQHTVDPLALMSNVSPQQYSSQSSTTPPSTHVSLVTYQPHFADNTQHDSGLSLTDNLIKKLTNTLALLTQSHKTYLPQTNNQLRTSSNTRNQATVQDGMVVVQNVQGRQNKGQGNNAKGTCAACNEGAQNRVGNVNPEYFKDKMLLMQAQENGVMLDEEQLMFIAGGQDNVVDEDVDEPLVQDSALNVDNVFQADECDAFDSDVDEAPTAQTILDANLLRKALEITPVDQAHQSVSPLSGDAIMDFVNQLGYPGEIHFVSRMAVNNLYQPWRAILSIINQCLTGKTSGFDRPDIQSFKCCGSYQKGQEDQTSCYSLQSIHKANHLPLRETSQYSPKELITNNIRNAPYYNAYLEMVAKHERIIAAKIEGSNKKMDPKADKHMKPAPAKQAKPATAKQPMLKPLVDEPDEEQDQPEVVPEPQGAGEEYDLERAIQMSLESFLVHGQAHVGDVATREPVAEATRPLLVVKGKGKAIATKEQRQILATDEAFTGPSTQPQDDTFANVVCETPSPTNAKTGADMDKVISEGDAEILNIDLGKTPESRPPPDDDKMDEDQARSDPGKSHVALTGSNPEPMHDDFVTTIYPKVYESLKFSADEHVILEDPPSSSGTLYSMKNLDDTYTFGDQFFNDKSTEDDPGKQNVDAEVVSMVTVSIHQASTSVPSLSTPIIDLSPPKPAASPLRESFTAATT
uniref:Integrase, catalytic region, zinc finger, CCHC-type, peptidase aspartic, catalytic n=1 Tax=Tanacetum cinerariifolium TaxID=118510 RepID=A0A699GZX2_TANCI|nr:hypothetical protein [Tanacetum cinerariifolium]